MPLRRSVVLLLCLCALGAAGPAAASPTPQLWRKISSGGMNVSDQVGLARTADGALHVAWRRRAGGAQDLLQNTINASGRVGPPVSVLTGWASVGSPALVANGGALAVVFPGTETLNTGDPRFGLDRADSTDGGASWSVNPTAIAQDQFAGSSTPAAVLSAGGSFLTSWSAPEGTVVHVGSNPSVPAVGGYGDGIDQALAATYDGHVMAAWCSSGVSVSGVDPLTGARAGEVLALPGTGRCPADTRVALASFRTKSLLENSTVFVAASSADGRRVIVSGLDAKNLSVDRFDQPSSGASFKQQIALAAAPHVGGSHDGGLWVAWRDSRTDALVFRRVRHGGVWGAAVTVPLPAGQSLSQLQLDAQDDRVDVIARTSNNANVVNLFATQVRPGLTLEGAPSAKAIRKRGFRVLDAEDGVAGATVRVAGRRLTTRGDGYAKVDLPAGSYKVTASKAGYVGASLRVRLR